MGAEAEFIKVTDHKDFLAYDILSTPGLAINGKVLSSGRIPAPSSVSVRIAEALKPA